MCRLPSEVACMMYSDKLGLERQRQNCGECAEELYPLMFTFFLSSEGTTRLQRLMIPL